MDKRKNNGGHSNGGRKSKAEEQKLIEKLTPISDEAYLALRLAVNKGDGWAIKLWFEYMYGKPKQATDITTNGNDINISPIEWVE
jgi:hypothetical protein